MQVENLGMRVSEYIPEGLLLPFSYHLYLPNGNELVLTIRTLFCKSPCGRNSEEEELRPQPVLDPIQGLGSGCLGRWREA